MYELQTFATQIQTEMVLGNGTKIQYGLSLQMRQVLRLNTTDDQLHQAFSGILSSLNQPQQAYKLYMANRMFGDKSHAFLDEFLSAVREYYGAELAPVDFR